MCDYSLMGIPNRLATEGEQLAVYSFPTRTKGLTSPMDLATAKPLYQPVGFWGVLKRMFQTPKIDSVPAVCIPPGARLLLHDIPLDIQHSAEVGAVEEVTFTQLTAAANSHRDAIRFANGTEISLQALADGQRVRVLSLELAPTYEIFHGEGRSAL